MGPGDSFAFQWASGHQNGVHLDRSGDAILTVLHEDNEHWMKHPKYLEFVKDYINSAPAGSNLIQNNPIKYTRVHASVLDDIVDYHISGYPHKSYDRILTPGQPGYHLHPETIGRTVYAFNPLHIADDVHVSYSSVKYPWIEAAHSYQQTGRASDYDVARVEVPGRHCSSSEQSCHYIVHWRWGGYSDCMDVDYFHTPVQEIYGVPSSTPYKYFQKDHCQFVEPRLVLSPCIVMTNNNASAFIT